MEISIGFPGGKKVEAEVNGMRIMTDQPASAGGEGTAPTPFEFFLASIGACAGIYALSFCQERGIDTKDMSLSQRMEFEPAAGGKQRLSKLALDLQLPAGFPVKYRHAIVKAMELCTVKKTIFDPPEFTVTAQ